MAGLDETFHFEGGLKEGTIAMLGFPVAQMGSVLDVGLGGIAVQYIENCSKPKDSNELDILYTGKLFYLNKIPYQTVSDVAIKDDLAPNGLFSIRRRGIKFGKLTPIQKSQLEYFIKDCAQGEL